MRYSSEGVILTSTHHPSILGMSAIVCPPAIVITLVKAGLQTCTQHVVQPDDAPPLSKLRPGGDTGGVAVPQLMTHHVTIVDVPLVVTDSAPCAVVLDLHTPLAPVGAALQAYGVLRCSVV